MAYSTANPPVPVSMGPLAGYNTTETPAGYPGRKIWSYVSADVIATVAAAGYFTNGIQLGMQVGDVVIVMDTTTPKLSIGMILSLTSTGIGQGAANMNVTTFASAT
jgi:hypothetical protein